MNKALIALRKDESLVEMEEMLAFFASFVLDLDVVKGMMRWDMAILRESPWYNEIIQEGRKEGREQMLLEVLTIRFGALSDDLRDKIHNLKREHLQKLTVVATKADSLTAVSDYLATV